MRAIAPKDIFFYIHCNSTTALFARKDKSMRMRAALYILFAFFISQQLIAQEAVIPDNPLFPNPRPKRIFIGPIVGYNSNFHSGGFLTLGAPSLNVPDC